MTISDLAPYAMGVLLVLAIPVFILLCQLKGQERDRGDSCMLIGILIFLLVAMLGIAWLWAAQSL